MNCKKSGVVPSRPDTLIQLCIPFKSLPGRKNVSKSVLRFFRILLRRDIKCYKLTTCISPQWPQKIHRPHGAPWTLSHHYCLGRSSTDHSGVLSKGATMKLLFSLFQCTEGVRGASVATRSLINLELYIFFFSCNLLSLWLLVAFFYLLCSWWSLISDSRQRIKPCSSTNAAMGLWESPTRTRGRRQYKALWRWSRPRTPLAPLQLFVL